MLLSFIIAIVLNGCSKGTSLKDGNPEILMGKWICTKMEWDVSYENEHGSDTYDDEGHYLVLSVDGTGTIKPYNLFEPEIRNSFNWVVSNGKLLVFVSNSRVVTFNIEKINSNTLILVWDDSDEDGFFKETGTFKKATS